MKKNDFKTLREKTEKIIASVEELILDMEETYRTIQNKTGAATARQPLETVRAELALCRDNPMLQNEQFSQLLAEAQKYQMS
jgi:hypothetical protein